jgi:prolyl oligopeptidase
LITLSVFYHSPILFSLKICSEIKKIIQYTAKRENRQLAYDDFIAVAEDLIKRGVTSPEHLGIRGGSNGGMLMGNMIVQRPDLFGAVCCAVPLLDMKIYHRLLAGNSWMAEYGDPSTEDWKFLQACIYTY